jgi:hypothetical protein
MQIGFLFNEPFYLSKKKISKLYANLTASAFFFATKEIQSSMLNVFSGS